MFPRFARRSLARQQSHAGMRLADAAPECRAAEPAATRSFVAAACFLLLGTNGFRLAHKRAGGRRQVDIHGSDLLLPRQSTDALARRFCGRSVGKWTVLSSSVQASALWPVMILT